MIIRRYGRTDGGTGGTIEFLIERRLKHEREMMAERTYLQHDIADVEDTLGDSL